MVARCCPEGMGIPCRYWSLKHLCSFESAVFCRLADICSSDVSVATFVGFVSISSTVLCPLLRVKIFLVVFIMFFDAEHCVVEISFLVKFIVFTAKLRNSAFFVVSPGIIQ